MSLRPEFRCEKDRKVFWSGAFSLGMSEFTFRIATGETGSDGVMSEGGQVDDLSRVIKVLYRYALDPGGWVDLIDAMREIEPEWDGGLVQAALRDHFDIAAALAVHQTPAGQETVASLELSLSLKVLSLSATAADAFRPILGPLDVGDQLDPDASDAAAALANGIAALRGTSNKKFPIVVPHNGKVSCSYLVRLGGSEERYVLYHMRNGYAEEYDLSTTVLSELTEREREICGLLFEGQTPQQIAGSMSLSPNTVKYHLKSIFAKTGINRQADLLRILEQAYQLERELERLLGSQSQLVIDQPRHVTLGGDLHPPKRSLTRNERSVAWREYGREDGRPVFWSPGLYASGRLWDGAIEAAEKFGLRLIAVDRPGYGETCPLDTPDINETTADAVAVLDHLNHEELDVFASAAGCLFALHLAHREPERVKRVFLSSAHFGPQGDWSKPNNRMRFALWFAQRNPGAIRAMMRLFVRPRAKKDQMANIRRMWSESKPDTEALRDDRLVEHLLEVGEEAMSHGVDGVVIDLKALITADDFLSEVRQPVVEWHGLEDFSTTWEMAGELLAPIPNLERVQMPHRGQLLFHTDFHRIAERIAMT